MAFGLDMDPPGDGAGRAASARAIDPSELELLRLALNQVDYGMVVLDVDTCVVQFANAPGRNALEEPPAGQPARRATGGLRLVHGRVIATRPVLADQLRATLERTKAGLRGLLSLDDGHQTGAVAVLPLSGTITSAATTRGGFPAPRASCFALLVFAKQQLCDDSTMALFARERGLTSAEGQVLTQICRGLRPAEIAVHHGVRISTVRTQLRSIRMKTCCETIRHLVQTVSVLPPMARHLARALPGSGL